MTIHRIFPAMKIKKHRHRILAVILVSCISIANYGQKDALFIDPTGKVGIGTSAPSQQLAVNGNTLFGLSDNIAIGIDNHAAAKFGFIKKSNAPAHITATTNTPVIFSHTNQADIFTNIATATLTERLRIDGNGNIGINNPVAASYRLTVAGNGNVFGVDNSALFSAKNAAGNYEQFLCPRWTDNAMYLTYGAGGLNIRNNANTSAVFIKENGNTGIGKIDPTAKLEVAGRVKDETGYITPQGGIIMYGGAMTNFDSTGKGKPDSPVAGWAICNGKNTTPDLRDRFIVGAGPGSKYEVGKTGGKDSVKLTIDEMPSHSHKYGYDCYDVVMPGKDGCWLRRINTNNGDQTSSAGGDKPHENRPPYYAMLYIMKL